MANMGNIAKSIGNMGFFINPNNSWMVYFMENPNLKLDDDWGVYQVTRFFPNGG